MPFQFENLDVWREAIALCDEVYFATRRFPDDERFGLTSQIRRASVSIAANIAEGRSRSTDRDFQRFLEIATGSLMETVSHLIIAHRQKMLDDNSFHSLYTTCERIGKMLSSLRNALKK